MCLEAANISLYLWPRWQKLQQTIVKNREHFGKSEGEIEADCGTANQGKIVAGGESKVLPIIPRFMISERGRKGLATNRSKP